jgi:hypothetical protein
LAAVRTEIILNLRFVSASLVIGLLLTVGACGKSSTAPTSDLQISSISPIQGSTTGGTAVVITGSAFTSDATVSIGGVSATTVVVQGSTQLSAIAGPRAAGIADVTVTSGARMATLANAFAFVAPPDPHQPPVVTNISDIGSRPNEPPGFADQGETVTLTASATDVQTSPGALTYLWTGPGTFGGTSATTTWQLPSTVTPVPSPVSVTLTALETYTEGKVTHQSLSDPRTFVIQVHDSQNEILEMGQDFLTLFSQTNISTADALHNFSTTCDSGRGRADEASDTDQNRAIYIQDFSAFRISRRGPATINFQSRCLLPDGRTQNHVDACATYAVHWEVIRRSTGAREITNGVDYISAVVENDAWHLCHSSFIGSPGYPSLGLR